MNVENQDVLLDLEGEEEEEEDDDNDDGEIVLELNQVIIPTYGTVPDQQNLHTPEWVDFDEKPDSLFFKDGQRRIDFVLVYEDESKKMTHRRSDRKKQKRKRQVYESNLINNGLQLEATRSVLDEKLIFVKVHAPWEVLCTYAEVMHIKLPLQHNDLKTRKSAFNWFSRLFRVDENIIKPEQEFFTAPFQKEHLSNFYIQDKDTFFNPATRSRIVHFILSRVEYATKNNVKKFGINKLLDTGIYKAAFPLHDSSFRHLSTDPSCPSERYLLYREWAHPKNIFKLQPLDFIRKYYGEKIGIYFAWLGFYTNMLTVAAVVGVGCFLYGCLTKDNCTWSQEVCDPNIGGNIIMCPQCDRVCTYWNLTITCESSKKLCIFDSYGTLVFAVFMGIWVTFFLEFWKRRQAELEYEWDTVEYLEQEEQVRPEYEARCTHVVMNEITQQEEHVPYTACGKCIRMTFCTSAIFFWILLIIASVVGIIVYRLSVFLAFSSKLSQHINGTEAIRKYLTPQTATSVTASLISFVVIMILNIIYEKVAILITDFELPRTQTDYENSLTTKMFLFQFVNYYSSCFYIAFFKGKFVGHPGSPVYWLGKYRNEECDPGGCLLELTTQLAIIVGGKAIWNNIQEVLVPLVKNLIGRYSAAAKSEKVVPRWEHDYHLQPIGKLGLFYEYLEMVIQFGFVTLFVASFPLAPLLALINNMLEIRLDAWKLTTQFRRMVPQKAQDIGAWQPILQGIAILAVVTNALIIAFTSDMIPRLVYYWSFSVPPYGSHSTHTMEGYINSTLSVFSISDFKNESKPSSPWFGNQTTCRYRDLRYPPGHQHQYEHNIYYWHVIAAKLAFIIVMEHVIYFVKFIISYVIPDVSEKTKSKVKREKYLTQKLLHENDLKGVKKTMGKIADKIIKGADSTFRPKDE
ncbi:anoctamin-6 isoform X1 [Serinus canaria]|uniref:anoctamin-6 isoform X1 n=1 Tax=Serinus canaria TaxID=9135 RepID=UPI0021CC7CFB|nr:anoctamin-6 isoform X1 [Serinus canaria]